VLTAHNLLDPNVPIHQQLYLLLRNEILDGLWAHAQAFPGEQEMAERYGVSVITSRKVLDRLGAEGLLERGRGRRPKVTYVPPPARRAAPPVIFSRKVAEAFAYEVLSVGTAPAPAEACDTFGLPHGSPLWQLKRLRRFEGRPHSVTHNAQSPERGAAHDPAMLGRRAMGQILAGEGVKLGRLTRRIGVALAPVDVAGPLGISVHDACLLHTMTLADTAGAPVEWLRIYVHPAETMPTEVFDLRSSAWETIAS
jgi:GntR family transcriptional regulator